LRKYIFENRTKILVSTLGAHAQTLDRPVLGKRENLLALDNGSARARATAVNP
jgi:hypothetical protein